MSRDPLPHDFTGAVEPSAQIETFEASPQTFASAQVLFTLPFSIANSERRTSFATSAA